MGRPGTWQLQAPNMLYSGRPHLWNPEDSPWYACLYAQPEFREAVRDCYKEQLKPFLQQLLEEELDRYVQTVAVSADMNRIRWNLEDPLQAARQIHSYMTERMDFLDSYWLEEEPYQLVQLYIQWHVMACYAVQPGDRVPEQPVPEGSDTIHYDGWCDLEDGALFDFSQPIDRNRILYLREVDLSSGQEQEIGGGGLSGKIWFIPICALLFLLGTVLWGEWYRHRAGRTPGAEKKTAGKVR